MDKNSDFEIKNFLNSNENLEIPKEISNGINKVLNKIEKREKFKKWMKGGSIAASLLILITIGLGTAFPALAQQAAAISRILGKESLFNKVFQNSFYKSDISNVQNNSIAVGQTSTDNGISVTMKEIAYDGTALYAVYQVKSDIPHNDKFRNAGNISIGGETTDFVGNNVIAIQTIDNNTAQFVQMFLISGEEKLEDKFNVSINFTELLFKKGNWSFNMTLDKNELAKDSKLTDLNKVVNFNSGKANVRTLAQSSTFATLTVDYDNYNRNKDYYNFSLIDNNGTELQQIEFATQEIKKGEKTEVITVYKASKDTIIKKVVANQTLIEYYYPEEYKNFTYVNLNTNFPKAVTIGPGKEITINSISLREGYTTYPPNENSKYKYYVFTITAKDLSIQDYVSKGGITIYHKDKAKTKPDAYGTAMAYVVGKNTYEIRFLGDASKQATNCVLAFATYDEVLDQKAEIKIK